MSLISSQHIFCHYACVLGQSMLRQAYLDLELELNTSIYRLLRLTTDKDDRVSEALRSLYNLCY